MLEKLRNLLSGGKINAKKAEEQVRIIAEEARIIAEVMKRDLEARELADKKNALAKEKRKVRKAEKLKKQAEENAKKNSPKEVATANGEPWVQVLNVELDKDNPGAGAFELDWNDIFVARLLKSGYQGKTDADVIDNWFTDLCRHIALETLNQELADPDKRKAFNNKRKDLGDGKAEFS